MEDLNHHQVSKGSFKHKKITAFTAIKNFKGVNRGYKKNQNAAVENLERFKLHTPTACFHFCKLYLLQAEQGQKLLWMCCSFYCLLPTFPQVYGA